MSVKVASEDARVKRVEADAIGQFRRVGAVPDCEVGQHAGRDPAAITRIVVTKFHPLELIDELAALGWTVRDGADGPELVRA